MKNLIFIICIMLLVKISIFAQTPYLVKDINVGASDSYPSSLFNFNEILLFTATTQHGRELWRSDGTTTGTVMIKDIRSGVNDSDIQSLILFNNSVFFMANDGGGTDLWKTDGTELGTVKVKDFSTAIGLRETIIFGGFLYFTHQDQIWKSDGTTNGTVLLKQFEFGGNPRELTIAGNTLFFTSYTSIHKEELWKTDGTSNGTIMVKDIFEGSPNFGSSPTFLTNFAGILFFSATINVFGKTAFFRSDGTTAGTFMVKNISPSNITVFNNELYITAYDDVANSTGTWKSDGTANGTTMFINNFGIYFEYKTIATSIIYNNKLLFHGFSSTTGQDLWQTDGTVAGTILVKDINNGQSANVKYLTEYKGLVYFGAIDGINGNELWRTNGTTNGTNMVSDIAPGAGWGYPTHIIKVNDMLFFSAGNGVNDTELWGYRIVSSPCDDPLTLQSPANDISSGIVTHQTNNTITASNKITGASNVTYRSNKSITLSPATNGFTVANGAVFKAEIGGCN